ncbi:ESX secretion-associated protein EspG [Nocardia sp. 2]|uniref:ESX secretion-associated protein EspG n=1 Tax=Nocardia acididurans TaxID=2802282 RepID=A0ABS1M576_9NOCA|nr:ESX secretion-associated protein EspG [Nocardia acididurans]MBL1075210.1 ESX secretion-associated protein EspG [Nocardia acididurans]
MKWEFSDIEFKVLCNRYRQNRIPAPLVYTCRTRSEVEYEHQLAEANSRLLERLPADFRTVFETLVRPDVAVFAQVWCDREMKNPEKRFRIHGARRGHRACMLTQSPGETIWHTSGFTLTECEPDELPALLVSQLPAAEAASGPDVPIVIDSGQPEADYAPRPSAFDSFDEPDSARGLAFLSKPAEWTGGFKIRQVRSKYGPRGMTGKTLLWRDLPGDGRYLIELDELEMRAAGASAQRIAERIGAGVSHVLEHMTARGEGEFDA